MKSLLLHRNMLRNRIFTVLLTAQILFVSAPFRVWAHDPAPAPTVITSRIEVLRDSLSRFTLAEVTSPSAPLNFLPDSTLKFDTKSHTYWLRLSIRGTNQTPEFWTLKLPHIDTAEIFIPDTAGNFHSLISGEDIPFAQRAVQYGEYVCFQVPVTNADVVMYVRLTSVSRYSLEFRRLHGVKLIPPATFVASAQYARYFHGVFLGVTLAMIIFNLIIYVMYRDKSYIVYSGFMVTQTLYHLAVTGFLQEFVFYNAPSVGKYSPYVIAGISLIGYMIFSQVYLETKKYTPKLHRIYNYLYSLIIITLLYGYFVNITIGNSVLLVTGLLVITFPFSMSIIAYRQQYRPAMYFLIASVMAYVAYFIYVPMGLKLIPEVFLTRYSLQIAFALQSLLFAMGLADRMNLIRKELEQKKLEQSRLEKEQEIAIKNLLEKQNEELEIKVRERTLELEEKNQEVELDRQIIQEEREKSDLLLLNILPETIAQRLKSGEEMIAERFDNVTVFFSDIVGFTNISKRISPEHLVGQLNAIFTEFDKLAMEFGLEKIKTIGDAYMCVCGLPEPKVDHAERVARFALGVLDVMEKHTDTASGSPIAVRIGINSGTVIAGVIGKQKFAYDLWGETVNTASPLESHGVSGKIQCSTATYDLLKDHFHFEDRGEIDLKGIGMTKTYFLVSCKS